MAESDAPEEASVKAIGASIRAAQYRSHSQTYQRQEADQCGHAKLRRVLQKVTMCVFHFQLFTGGGEF
ncbi:uncharacterized protein METZ01_LOCUS67368, partial [marine metagenome]